MNESLSHQIYYQHIDILARHQLVKMILATEKNREVKVQVCEYALRKLVEHIEEENVIMEQTGYPEESRKPHVDHHTMIAEYLAIELRQFRSGVSDGMQAMKMADEWIKNHAELFDNALTTFLLGK